MILKVPIILGYAVAFNLVAGFIPNSFRLLIAETAFSSNGKSFTHPDLTRDALLQVAADVMIDNPYPANERSSQDVEQLSRVNLSVSRLVDAYFGGSDSLAAVRGRQKAQLERVVAMVIDFNAMVDSHEKARRAAAHFDSEQFVDGQQRLIDLCDLISQKITKGNFVIARRFMGQMLHTLQDFYSHSNWIEIATSQGVSDPSPNLVLGESGTSVGNTASPNTRTCANCTKTGEIVLVGFLALLSSFIDSVSCYNCSNNLERFLEIETILTSGYTNNGRDSQNRMITKPDGKCSHGGVIDGSQDSPAIGGINKDSTHDKLSPHYYLHAQAAATARQHSYVMLSKIRNSVNNDEVFGEFLGLQVNQVVSLAMIVDTTQRTTDQLQEILTLIIQIASNIQQYTSTLETNLRVRYILVPVDDSGPGAVFETADSNHLSTMVAGLNIQSSGGGTVPTIEAILAAARASEPESSIFVFTDSIPTDDNLLGQAKAVIAQKNLKVAFIHDTFSLNKRSIGDSKQLRMNKLRHKRQSDISSVYKELEVFSGGETIAVPKTEISVLAAYISFSAIQSNIIMFRREATLSGSTEHYFLVCSYTFQLLMFVNGQSINVSTITTPQGRDATTFVQYSAIVNSSSLYIATMHITNSSLYGQWTITLTSQGTYSIQVLGNSELTFVSKIITSNPISDDDINDLKPLGGLLASAEFTMVGNTNPVTINTLDIIDDEGVIQSINDLIEINNDTYASMFTLPLVEFKMVANGVDDNGYNFSYISDISIEPTFLSLSFGENDNGYLTLRPGVASDITILLLNVGIDDTFRVSVNTDASSDEMGYFWYTVMPEYISATQNVPIPISIQVLLASTIPKGLSVTFTVVVQSTSNFGTNDFISFDVVNVEEPIASSATVHVLPLLEMKLLITSVILLSFHNEL